MRRRGRKEWEEVSLLSGQLKPPRSIQGLYRKVKQTVALFLWLCPPLSTHTGQAAQPGPTPGLELGSASALLPSWEVLGKSLNLSEAG